MQGAQVEAGILPWKLLGWSGWSGQTVTLTLLYGFNSWALFPVLLGPLGPGATFAWYPF